jgi:hypothetical protein
VKGKFPLYSRTRASGFPSQGSRREYICVNFLADAIRRIPRAKRKPIARQFRSPSIFLASYLSRVVVLVVVVIVVVVVVVVVFREKTVPPG